jgi:hypothetical protein
MREFGGIVAALLFGACSTEAAPATQVASQAKRVQVETDIILAPTEPTPAFVPARDGACPRAYRPVDGSCVHHAYVAADPVTLQQALDAYRRGAAPPMLGPPKPRQAVAPPEPRRALDPGSLARGTSDAGAQRARRLAELDAMIAAAKEKLRERDENSKARRVESPRNAAREPLPSPAPLPAAGSATAVGSEAAADPTTQARLAELSQLTSQLPPEQLQAITAQLSQAGLDMRELEQLLSSARSGDAPR